MIKKLVATTAILLFSSFSSADWRYGAGLGINMSPKMTFDEAKDSNGSDTYTIELNFGSSFLLDLDARNLEANSWGPIFGLTYEAERQVTTATTTDLTPVTANVKDSAKFQVTTISAAVAYSWNQFYVPVGFNYSNYSITASSRFNGSLTAAGGLGFQFGLGYMADTNIAVEFLVRSAYGKIVQTEPAVTTDYGKGYLVESTLAAKYLF